MLLVVLTWYMVAVPVHSASGGTCFLRVKVPAPSNDPSGPNNKARGALGDMGECYFSGKRKQTWGHNLKETTPLLSCSSVSLGFPNAENIIWY